MSAAARPPADRGPATRATPLLPETLADGRYRLVERLGVGGMGVVMRARDELLDRDVAVKLLADNLSMDEGARGRFLQEARAAAAISDPRVVGVFDVGDEDGRPYLVMELVDGPSLAEVLASRGPLSGDDTLTAATEALAGLASAHDAGLLHRDIKPGNLLCAPDGTVKVADFGVAIAADGDRLTRTGFVIGTAAYLAPERRRGAAATVRSDLWALGATLTELLTGHPPGADADRALAARGDDVPWQLRRLLRHLLAEDPLQRPPDALAALEVIAGDASASLATTPPPPTRPSADRPWVTGPPDADTAEFVTPVDPPGAAAASGGTTRGASAAGSAGAAEPAPTREGRPRRRRLLLLVSLVVLAALALALVMLWDGSPQGAAPDEGFGPVVVDPVDPAGTVRELGELLRERAGP